MVPVHVIANAMVLPVVRGEETLYFLLDTGMPRSFCRRALVLEGSDFGSTAGQWEIGPWGPEVVLGDAGLMFGLRLAGMIGADILCSFRRLTLDYRRALLEVDGPPIAAAHTMVLSSGLFVRGRLGGCDGAESLFIDTGSMSSFCQRALPDYPRCSGWRAPTPGGWQRVDLHADVSVSLEGGPTVAGIVATGLPFPTMLGGDFLSRFAAVQFDFLADELRLGEAHEAPVLDLRGPYTLGVQLAFDEAGCRVLAVLPGHESCGLAVGDRLSFPDLDPATPGAVDEMLRRVTFRASEAPVTLLCNSEARTVTPGRLYA